MIRIASGSPGAFTAGMISMGDEKGDCLGVIWVKNEHAIAGKMKELCVVCGKECLKDALLKGMSEGVVGAPMGDCYAYTHT